MRPASEKLLKVTRVACIIATYGLAGILVLQPSNRYEWMAARGVELPVDDDSPGRVWMLAAMVAIAALVTLGLSVAVVREGRRLRLMWWSMLPLGYAAWRVAGVCLAAS